MSDSEKNNISPKMSDIVIAGIAGKFPNAKNVQELSDKLFEKVYLVGDSEKRFKLNISTYPKSLGFIDGLDKCDSTSTRTSLMLIKSCDPQLRLLSEVVFEAILDAGICAEEIKNSNTGVYVGCSNYDSLAYWQLHQSIAGMSTIANSAYSMSNRISYMLDVKGPSQTIDTACSSSFYALNAAYNDIKIGKCDSAIVAGTNMILHPMGMDDGVRGGVLTLNGVSQPFDKNSSGFIRSEAICVVYLQKSENARRNYASIVNVGTANDGFKLSGATTPSQPEIEKLLMKTYKEANLKPLDINFVESHAASTQIGDKIQVDSINNVFCNEKREKPLKIGSVKSNTGHTESASGLVSLTKSLLMFENEKIIPNINIQQVRDDCDGFTQGNIEVATEVEEFHDDFIGIDNFGILGANSHCIIKRNEKPKIDHGFPKDNLPRLILWSGRTIEAVNKVFDSILEQPLDDEFIALIQKTQKQTPTSLFPQKGFAIYSSDQIDRRTICNDRQIKDFKSSDKQSVVFVYSGVGSQWIGMAKSLLKIPFIADKIDECHRALENRNVDLKYILISNEPDMFKNCVNIFVGIVAIQIALTELLAKIGIRADYFIGHSVGELACAYADGTLTLEQTMLAAHARGFAINSKCHREGRMAAIAMKYEELKKSITNGIEIACHNSKESFTISGDVEKVEGFVAEVKKTGVLAKIVDSAGIAFHSSHMSDCDELIGTLLKDIIKTPKIRSEKWISTSENEDIDGYSTFSDASYFKNNLLSPVRFAQGMSKLPKNSLVIEIAPHSLLQGIVKQNLPECNYVGLTHRNAEDGVVHLLQSFGKIFQSGHDLDIREMYPKIDFPVSRGTRMIAPLIKWNHAETHFVPYFDPYKRFDKRELTINLYNPKFSCFTAHQIDGQIILPATGYVELVWETLAMMHGQDMNKFSVGFENIRFHKAIILSPTRETDISINIQRGSGNFEVTENNETVATGIIKKLDHGVLSNKKVRSMKEDEFIMNRDDYYKKLRLRGYEYLNDFKLIQKIQPFNSDKSIRGQIEWRSNWTCFTDCITQFFLMETDSRDLFLPVSVRKIVIDTETHFAKLSDDHPEVERSEDGKIFLNAEFDGNRNMYTCGGVQLTDPQGKTISRRKHIALKAMESFKFVSHHPTPKLSVTDAINFCCQLFVDNISSFRQVIVEVDDDQTSILSEIDKNLSNLQFSSQECYLLTTKENIDNKSIILTKSDEILSDVNLLIIKKTLNFDDLTSYVQRMEQSCMIIWRDHKNGQKLDKILEGLRFIAEVKLNDETWFVYTKFEFIEATPEEVYEIPSNIFDFSWVEDLKTKIDGVKIFHGRSKANELSGIDAFYKSVVKDMNLKNTQCFFIDDDSAPEFDLNNKFYNDQMKLGLSINTFKNGCWGSYRHLQYPVENEPKSYADHCFVNVTKKGDLNSVQWMNGNIDTSDENLVEVHYGTLNFKDVLIAMKRIQQDPDNYVNLQYNCGLEYSGIDKSGRKVLGCTKNKSLSNFALKREFTSFYAHPDWTLEEAATVPLSYMTVYYSFFYHADVQAGESILIHSGTGGLGQAAIHTALTYGMKVYATVGTEEKKKILLELFPQLCAEDIGYSHDTSFEDMIMERTNGVGVNYVLNSLVDDKLHASVRCVAKDGTFLEVGRFDMENSSNFNMKNFIRQINFKTVYLSYPNILRMSEVKRSNLLNKFQEDITTGKIKPLTRTVFAANDVQKAFRYLSSNKHIGKVVIKIRENETSKLTLPIELMPRVYFNPNKSYIITGGLGGMGLELVEWMIMRDCRKLVLASRRGISNSYQGFKIRLWRNYGAEIIICTADITTKSGCQEMVDESMKLGPVGGVFSLAAVLDNEYFKNQTPAAFTNTFQAKVHAASYLDEITRESCPELDHFLVFSSIASGRGGVTQSNYSMANSVTERLVERRHDDGLPGKAIQWGPVAGIGMLESYEKQSFHGLELQPISSCLELMDSFLMSSEVVCCSWHYSKKIKFQKQDSFFDIFMQVLGISDWKDIDNECTLSDMGVDSMSGTEIQHILGRDFGVDITLKELRMKKVGDLKKFLK